MAIASYTKTIWVDNQAPARSADNLNKQEVGIWTVTEEAKRLALWIDSTKSKIDYAVATPPTALEGRTFYDSARNSLGYYNDLLRVDAGRETLVRVYNSSVSTMKAGAPIYGAVGISGESPIVALSKADSFSTSSVSAVVKEDIPTLSYGYVTVIGEIENVDTSTFSIGDKLYLSDTVAGGLTNVAPDVISFVGVVLTVSILGKILVNPKVA